MGNMKKRWIKIGLVVAVVLAVGALSLVSLNGTSEAQGPGGQNNNGRGGNGIQDQTRQQLYIDGTCDCDQTGLMIGTGMQMRGRNANQSQLGLGLNLPPAVPGDVPADVVDALTAGLMDEYNAYATYQAVIDQFGAVAPFVNIQAAEAQHIAALENIFNRYGLTIPAPTAQSVSQFATLADACAAGAEAEIANFSLYDQWISTVQDYPDMVQVFTALRDASEFSHLPAFELCAG